MDRIIHNFDSTAAPLRSPLMYKEAVKLHPACGAFLFFLRRLEQIAPASQFPEMSRGLRSQFMSGFLDCDLVAALEEQIPNAPEVANVKAFRPHFFQMIGSIQKIVPSGFFYCNDCMSCFKL